MPTGDASVAAYVYKDANESLHHSYNLPGILQFITDHSPQTVLDVGCGNGSLAAKIAERGHKVIGIDIAADGIAMGRRAFPNVSLYCRNVYDDLSDILPPDGVDVGVSCEVIEHLYSPDRYLDSMRNAIRPGGYAIITTPYHGWLKNFAIGLVGGWDDHFMVHFEGGHIKFFSRKTLYEMLSRHGFGDFKFLGAGRLPLIWMSMIVRATRW